MADDPGNIDELEPWLQALLAGLTPAQRTRVARKVGQLLRRSNVRRIAANVQPDGTAMERRKPRPRLKDRERPKSGKMFPRLRLAKSMQVKPSPDGVEVGFGGVIARTARAHQFGLVDFVGRTADGRTIRTRYPQRVLLGFSEADRDAILEEVAKLAGSD